MEKGNILDLYKENSLLENIFLSISWALSCVIPFTLLCLKFKISGILWIIMAISILIYKKLKEKRTKQKISISLMPSIKF